MICCHFSRNKEMKAFWILWRFLIWLFKKTHQRSKTKGLWEHTVAFKVSPVPGPPEMYAGVNMLKGGFRSKVTWRSSILELAVAIITVFRWEVADSITLTHPAHSPPDSWPYRCAWETPWQKVVGPHVDMCCLRGASPLSLCWPGGAPHQCAPPCPHWGEPVESSNPSHWSEMGKRLSVDKWLSQYKADGFLLRRWPPGAGRKGRDEKRTTKLLVCPQPRGRCYHAKPSSL